MTRLTGHEDEVVQLYKAGESTLMLGRRFGVHESTVVRCMRNMGAPRRSLSEARLLAFATGRLVQGSGPANTNWRGGRTEHEGYILVLVDGVYVRENRLVLAEKLGRPLGDDEVAHHLNQNRADNRAENLVAMTRDAHTVLHRAQERRTMASSRPTTQQEV